MPSAKLAVVASVAALALVGCGGVQVKPAAPQASRGVIDDPRTHVPDRVACMRQAGLSVSEVGETELRIGSAPAGASVAFEPTPGAAQAAQIHGVAQGAEVVGAALLYPHQASDADLKIVEACLAKNVTG